MYHYPKHHQNPHRPLNHRLETFRQTLEPNLKPIANAISTAANMASTAAHDQYQKIVETAKERRRTQQEAEAYSGPYRLGERGRRRGGVEATAAKDNLFGFDWSDSPGGAGGYLGDEEGVSTDPFLPSGSMREDDKNPFLVLDYFRLTPRRDGWELAANLDFFFTSLYNYYHYKGLIPIVGRGLVELISLFFTLGLSVFLFVFLDWRKLATCRDEPSCHDFEHYIISKVS